ncbi:MAG: S1 RNA-binding domain-containing protein, partial [Clostridia bacterium]|nr:S1 RNA-binding domain-containing protein [Clostridia bacterium]
MEPNTVRLPLNMIKANEIYPVTVKGLLPQGIIVQLDGTDYTTLIHISKIARRYVSDPAEFVSVGDKYKALGHIGGKRPELILSHLNLQPKASEVKPRQGKMPVAEEYVPKQHVPQSLDDMISAANRVYKDKVASQEKQNRPRRRNNQNGRK